MIVTLYLTLSAFAVTMANMGMFLSHSRPLVKNDNPFIESFFRTLKYHAGYPRCFAAIDEARSWTAGFINWYNTIHRHLGIGYVTPVQRRTGVSSNLFAKRNRTLQETWRKHPERFPERGPRMCGRSVWLSICILHGKPESFYIKKQDDCDILLDTKRRKPLLIFAYLRQKVNE